MVKRLAKIAVASATYAIDRPYDYLVPEKLWAQTKPGMRVLMPFGAGNRRTDGIVLAVAEAETAQKLKSIIALLDDVPVFTPELLRLSLWMREQCFCTVYDAARAVLPAGLWFALRDCCRLTDGTDRERAYAPPAVPLKRGSWWSFYSPTAAAPRCGRSGRPSAPRIPTRPSAS